MPTVSRPLVHQHDGEREEEDRGRDDRHDRDGEMETLEHAEGSGRPGGLARRPRDHTRHARVDVAREGAGVPGIGQRDVDGRDVFGSRRHARRSREIEQIREVQYFLTGNGAEPRRIGRGLVDARDAKLARASSGGIGRQPHHAADGQAFGRGQLAGNQNVRRLALSTRRHRHTHGGHYQNDPAERSERSNDRTIRTIRTSRMIRTTQLLDPRPLRVGDRHHRQP